MRRRSGLALLLVVGVLGILAVLGSAFAVLSRLERRAAVQRVHATKALLLARSGLEDALARLDMDQDPEADRNRYGGEDWNLSGGALSAFEAPEEVYRPGSPDRDACPLRHAMRPSFPVMAGPDPRHMGVDGKRRGYSGMFRSEEQTWALKVQTGGFHVNGGDPATPVTATTDYNFHLRRVLGILAEAIDQEDGSDDAIPVTQADGESLINLRPDSGWRSHDQIRDLALGGSQAKLEALKPYLALQAWVDKKVIRPNMPDVEQPLMTPPAYDGFLNNGYRAMWRLLNGRPNSAAGTKAPDFERINGKIVGRAPVDFAWARRRRPALLALLGNLKGAYREDGTGRRRLAHSKSATITLDWSLPSDDARAVADRILSSTSEMATWDQFNAFCDSLPLTGTSSLGEGKRDLLKAVFNPNSDLNKFNPDSSLARLTDKSDLILYSTELNLGPRGSANRMTSIGRVRGRNGDLLASRTLSLEAHADQRFCLTTQSEFVAGDLGSLGMAGDESSWRANTFSASAPYLTPSGGTGKTFGARIFQDPGVGLQTYPEAHTVWTPPASGALARPACYDGSLKLATTESEDEEFTPTGCTMMFLANFDSSWNADFSKIGGSLAADLTDTDPRTQVPAVTRCLWDSSVATLDNVLQNGTFFPDGAYIEAWKCPGYTATSNMAPCWGALSFWVKPNFDTAKEIGYFELGTWQTRDRAFVDNSKGISPATDIFRAGYCPQISGSSAFRGRFYFHWDNDFTAGDSVQELIQTTPWSAPRPSSAHDWLLMTVLWDSRTRGSDGNPGGAFWIDRGVDPCDQSATESPYPIVGSTSDFSLGSFYLGSRNKTNTTGQGMFSADATLDEFAIYDLGPSPAAIVSAQTLAQERFAAGRYYKESSYTGLTFPLGFARNAGEWFSAPINLGRVQLKSASWTQIVPRGLKAPVGAKAEDGDAGADGRVMLELVHADVRVPAVAGATYAVDTKGKLVGTRFTQAAGQRIDRTLAAPFRLHAVFQPNLDPAAAADKAILDPLALDDITIAYRDPLLPSVSAWSEGE